MKNIILTLIMGLVLIGMVSAEGEELAFEPGAEMDIKVYCFDTDRALCTSAVSCEINAFYPNLSTLFSGMPMTFNATGNYYNYTSTAPLNLGDYKAMVTCNDSINKGYSSFPFYIGRPSTNVQSATINRSIWILFGVAVLFFLGFLAISHIPTKWSCFLLGVLFVLITINMSFISLRNEAGSSNITSFFDTLAATSYIGYYFILGLILFIWLFSMLNTLNERKHMNAARRVGESTKFI